MWFVHHWRHLHIEQYFRMLKCHAGAIGSEVNQNKEFGPKFSEIRWKKYTFSDITIAKKATRMFLKFLNKKRIKNTLKSLKYECLVLVLPLDP